MARQKEKRLFLSEEENAILKKNAQLAGIPEGTFMRMLIKGYMPNEKMPNEFYQFINKLSAISDNLNQLKAKAFALNSIDADELAESLKRLNEFENDIYSLFIEPRRRDGNGMYKSGKCRK